MAAVPTSYQFIKAVNNNVVIIGLDGITPVVQYSLQPGKDLKIDERNPDNVLIPVEESKGAQNKFLSISYKKMDFANSTPSATNPADITEALDFLSSDFFFELGGGGGSVLARNGVVLSGSYVELGGDLVRITTIDTDGYDFSILNGDFNFFVGELSSFPSMGIFRADGAERFVNSIVDLSSVSGPDVNAVFGFSQGSNFIGLSATATATGSGFTSKNVGLSENISGGNSGGFIPSATSPSHYFNDVANNRTHSLSHQEGFSVLSLDDPDDNRRYEVQINSGTTEGDITLKVHDTFNNYVLNEFSFNYNSLLLKKITSYTDSNNYNFKRILISNGVFLTEDRTVVAGIESTLQTGVISPNAIISTGVTASNFADDTAAAAGGISIGEVYHNNGALRIRLV